MSIACLWRYRSQPEPTLGEEAGMDGECQARDPRSLTLAKYPHAGRRYPSCCQAGLRSDLNVARISETKIAVCSQAAKWVPLGNLL